MSTFSYFEVRSSVFDSILGESSSDGLARAQTELAFNQLREPVYRYIATAHRHPSEAEEITQDVFLRLYVCLRRGDQIRNVRLWAFTVARNSAISALRRKRSFGKARAHVVWSEFQHTIPDDQPTMEQALISLNESKEASERAMRIREAIGSLTDLQRDCFCLRVEGCCYREIAETVGISLQAAVNACERAAINIRKKVRC
jgi:RNA polymerase sigma-70 factor (ECF subfamily)